MTTATALPTTDKQRSLIEKLLAEKDVPAGMEIPPERTKASKMINWLLSQPKKTAPVTQGVTPGMYVAPNGEIVKVMPNKAKTQLYARVMVSISGERLTTGGEIVKWEWAYAPGLVARIRPEWKMDAETAHGLGIQSGRCLWCGRKLKDATSVALAMGPVCRSYFA